MSSLLSSTKGVSLSPSFCLIKSFMSATKETAESNNKFEQQIDTAVAAATGSSWSDQQPFRKKSSSNSR
ncbi:hypothetical protein L1987_09932 [Smallanthus sonchifolius]|uniref:Uncharacterized protein n=1 Tax=Smallanthus sonchifolius TaxID=185202 RepID=A0ACB9JQP5_9ASTR|nr:hypothetical protein L1987_09932 [Smallanthus sonchifolius]